MVTYTGKPHVFWAALLVVASLSACTSKGGSVFGTYELRTEDATIQYMIPGSLSQPDLRELERIRVELGGEPPPHYIVVTAANKGSAVLSVHRIAIRRQDGSQVTIQLASDLIKQWAAPNRSDRPLSYWFDVANQPRFLGEVAAGKEGMAILGVTQELDDTMKVEATTTGAFERV